MERGTPAACCWPAPPVASTTGRLRSRLISAHAGNDRGGGHVGSLDQFLKDDPRVRFRRPWDEVTVELPHENAPLVLLRAVAGVVGIGDEVGQQALEFPVALVGVLAQRGVAEREARRRWPA